MKISGQTIIRHESNVTLSPDEKFWYRSAWYRRKRWVNMISVTEYGFELYGSTNRHNDGELLRIYRAGWPRTTFRSPDQVPRMPGVLRNCIDAEQVKLRKLRLKTFRAGFTEDNG